MPTPRARLASRGERDGLSVGIPTMAAGEEGAAVGDLAESVVAQARPSRPVDRLRESREWLAGVDVESMGDRERLELITELER